MLKLNELKAAPGARKNTKRLGRGTGSGQGCTAGHGNNGDRARSGARVKLYFEGGQTPLTRRIPKRGFISPFKTEFQIVNVGAIETLDVTDKEITVELLHSKGLIHEVDRPVKVLGNGEISKAFVIKVHAFSKSAKDKIEKVKGRAEVVART